MTCKFLSPWTRCLVLWIVFAWIIESALTTIVYSQDGLRIATFDIDATPPIGSMMSYDPVRRVDELSLRARGIVLLGSGQPIVLCSIDWLGIANEGHDAFCQRLAKAASTSARRVAVHAIHQHDAPRCDFGAEALLHHFRKSDLGALDGSFPRETLDRLEVAVRDSLDAATAITHVGYGVADVVDVASNRRIQDETGRVVATRFTTTKEPELRAKPVGVIDPELTAVSFWADEKPVAILTYYACHPQSYYRTGIPSSDFPGIARFMLGQDQPNALHVHFNGAGGNLGAGKYNDGSTTNRMLLAKRLADAMRQAIAATVKSPVTSEDIGWQTVPVALPPAKHLNQEQLTQELVDWKGGPTWEPADKLAWLQRCQAGHKIELGCLRLGEIRILHMPGELFVEYQLAAKAMRPDLKVAMAAYGDYAPWYIGTAVAYGQGGYETSDRASLVGPEAEPILIQGMKQLLEVRE